MHIEQIAPGFKPLYSKNISDNVPLEEWFLHQEMAYGNHGLFHVTRTGLFAEIIAHKESLSSSARKMLHAAILIHDVDRENEDRDPTHGMRRIDYWERHLHLLKANGIHLNEAEQKTVIALRKYHETNPLNESQREELGEEGVKLLGILKLADALDRGRDPDNIKHIQLDRFNEYPRLRQIAEEILPFTQAFIQRTEELRAQGLIPYKTFVQAGREFGLVRTRFDTLLEYMGGGGQLRRRLSHSGA